MATHPRWETRLSGIPLLIALLTKKARTRPKSLSAFESGAAAPHSRTLSRFEDVFKLTDNFLYTTQAGYLNGYKQPFKTIV